MTEIEIKQAVRERDGYCCTECGMTNDEHVRLYGRILDVHRIIPGSVYAVESCVSLCRTCHGPKPRRPRGTFPPITKIERHLWRKARMIADTENISLTEYLDGILKPLVERDFALLVSKEDRPSQEGQS